MPTTGSRYRAAVVPTNFRPCLEQCLEALLQQAHRVIIIDTGGEIPDYVSGHRQITVIQDHQEPKNISRWWNLGLDYAAGQAKLYNFDRWEVAVINDDVIVPDRWFVTVADATRQAKAVAGCSGGRSNDNVLHTGSTLPLDLYTRIQGFAFVLVGESGLRADESFFWWCGDDDLHVRSALLGGMLMIPGFHVQHLHPDGQWTPELHAQAGKDMETFVTKWGARPWAL